MTQIAVKTLPAPMVDISKLDTGLSLDILGVPHGEDRQKQVFTESTDLGDLPVVPLVYFHGFDERNQRVVERIGWAVKAIRDKSGQWYRGMLDKANPLARKIYDDAVKGLARASSDAVAHLVRPTGIVGKPGIVTSWPVAFLSLMDSTTYDRAVNMNAVALPAVKAICSSTGPIGIPDASGEVSAKAGQVFASRNRSRITTLKDLHGQQATILDELLGEFPAEPAPEFAATVAASSSGVPAAPIPLVAPAAKSFLQISPTQVLPVDKDDLIAIINRRVALALKQRGLA